MKNHFIFKYEKFLGRTGIGLYVNGQLVKFSYDTFEAFRMITLALSRGDTVSYELTDDYHEKAEEGLKRWIK